MDERFESSISSSNLQFFTPYPISRLQVTVVIMAANVFGNPITDETLQSMTKYEKKQITRIDRVHEALNMKNAQSKDVNAQTYVENLDKQYGKGITTLCLVYNATGRDTWNGCMSMVSIARARGALFQAILTQEDSVAGTAIA
ncbi:hypothetical protein CFOL_v3_26167 [Cephalotus follicularis]|uniref:Uncharacterized protein n=1 Tax=Cephalotus follicularis TaxID=3775 RepID=A0A1Q3CR31_CEPFO|nr:hypothetical protein CFOL_v3_26167 [Cephalotus follicularis]